MHARLHVDIAAIQPVRGREVVSVASIAFMYAGRLHVTAVAKIALDMRADARMSFAAPPPIRDHDAVDPATRVAVFPNDLHPILGRADVTFIGSAHAPTPAGVRSMYTRLAIVRPVELGGPMDGGAALMDKALHIVGARRVTAADPNPSPEPFLSMSLTYAASRGGPDDPENPVGIGIVPDAGGGVAYPRVLSAVPGARGPIGYGPIDASWPIRQRLVRRRSGAAGADPHADDVDPAYYHSAPVDQRVEFLRGDEWVYMEGLHPRRAVFQTQLPCLTGRARIYGANGDARPLVMRADALHIQGSNSRCTLTYRGTFAVEDERRLGELRLVAGVEMLGQIAMWPTLEPVRRRAERTLVLDLPAPEVCSLGPPREETQRLEFGVLPSQFEDEGTLSLDVDAAPTVSERFVRVPAARDGGSVGAAGGEIPGAPWAQARLDPVPVAAPARDGHRSETVVLELGPEEPGRAAPAVAPVASVRGRARSDAALGRALPDEPASAAAPRPKAKVEWRVDRPADSTPAAQPARRAPEIAAPPPNVTGSLYKKFKR